MNVLDFFQKMAHKHIQNMLHKILKDTDIEKNIWENYVSRGFKTKIKFHGTAKKKIRKTLWVK